MKKIKHKKAKVIVYICLRALVLACLILQLINHNWSNVFTCVLVLIAFMLPKFIDRKLSIEFPAVLEIILVLFVFSAEILGEINAFYLKINNFDTLLHTLNGFIMGGVGFFIIDVLNDNKKTCFSLSPKYVIVASICFSMTIGILWEFCEYTNDRYFEADGQKDTIITKIISINFNEHGENVPVTKEIKTLVVNGEDWMKLYGGYIDIGLNDTMKDLWVNFLGSLAFAIIGWLYLLDKNTFAKNFIPYKKNSIVIK